MWVKRSYAFYGKIEKQKRKTNFSIAKVAVLTEFLKNHKEELFRKLSPSLTKQEKYNLWKDAAEKVSSVRFARSTEDKI